MKIKKKFIMKLTLETKINKFHTKRTKIAEEKKPVDVEIDIPDDMVKMLEIVNKKDDRSNILVSLNETRVCLEDVRLF